MCAAASAVAANDPTSWMPAEKFISSVLVLAGNAHTSSRAKSSPG